MRNQGRVSNITAVDRSAMTRRPLPHLPLPLPKPSGGGLAVLRFFCQKNLTHTVDKTDVDQISIFFQIVLFLLFFYSWLTALAAGYNQTSLSYTGNFELQTMATPLLSASGSSRQTP